MQFAIKKHPQNRTPIVLFPIGFLLDNSNFLNYHQLIVKIRSMEV